jgi:hypothetical protein
VQSGFGEWMGATGKDAGLSRCGASAKPEDAARRVQTPPKPTAMEDGDTIT